MKDLAVRRLTADYAMNVADLFRSSSADHEIRDLYYAGQRAASHRDELLQRLDFYAASVGPHVILESLIEEVGTLTLTEDLLIKLDWNSANVFLSDGRIHQFIDFEQAFIGTAEILVGVLLHNPIWHAPTLFRVLRQEDHCGLEIDQVHPYLSYSFGSMLIDSVERRGHAWDNGRLETAYQRHVTDRFNQLMARR